MMDVRRLKRFGPLAATTAALVLVGAVGIGDQRTAPPTGVYFAHIREAVDGLPYSIGRWIGEDEAVTPSARELLDPNVIVQRRYVDPETGEWFSVLVVHCGDMRDMQGHYPPVCYPAHGWSMRGSERADLGVEGVRYSVTEYRFAQEVGMREEQIVILNFFVMPSVEAPVTPTIARLRRLSQASGTAGLGSAQVQVLFSGSSTESYRREVFERVVSALRPMMREIASVPE